MGILICFDTIPVVTLLFTRTCALFSQIKDVSHILLTPSHSITLVKSFTKSLIPSSYGKTSFMKAPKVSKSVSIWRTNNKLFYYQTHKLLKLFCFRSYRRRCIRFIFWPASYDYGFNGTYPCLWDHSLRFLQVWSFSLYTDIQWVMFVVIVDYAMFSQKLVFYYSDVEFNRLQPSH